MAATHGWKIEWHDRDRSLYAVTIEGCSTSLEAWQEAMAYALQAGWTRPRWWQWWRWGDRDYSKLEPKR